MSAAKNDRADGEMSHGGAILPAQMQPAPTMPAAPVVARSRFPAWLGAVLLVLVTVLAYQPVWHAGFIWDDDAMLTANPLVKGGCQGLLDIWATAKFHDYVPLTLTTLWVEWRLWGEHALGYHLVNVLLHAFCAVLLWRALKRLGLPGAGLAATIFALHPVNVESVGWIAERKNTLAMFFYLLSVLLYVRSDEQPKVLSPESKVGNGPPTTHPVSRLSPFSILHPTSSLRYWLSLLAFTLALLSKTAVAPLPVVLLGIAWWQHGRVRLKDVWRSVPFFALAAGAGLVAFWFQYSRAIGASLLDVRSGSFWSRLAGAGWAIWFYLYKSLLPLKLSFVYWRWQIDPARVLSYVPDLLLILTFAVCWRYRRGWGRAALFGLGYFVVMLLPVLGFVNIYFMRFSLVSDHWQYFAIIGPIALVAAALTAAGETKVLAVQSNVVFPLTPTLSPRRGSTICRAGTESTASESCQTGAGGSLSLGERARVRGNSASNCIKAAVGSMCRHWGTALGGAVILVLGVLTWRQAQIYADEKTLWQVTIARNPACWMAHINLGNVLAANGQIDEPIRQYQEAIRLQPDNADAHNNLGATLLRKGQISEAIRQFREALRVQSDHAGAHYNLGTALDQKGQLDEAILEYQESIRIKPNSAGTHYSLGTALAMKGQIDEAIRHFQEAIRLQPDHADARNNLGAALISRGRTDEAIREFQEALRLRPEDADVKRNLARALELRGKSSGRTAHQP